MLELQLTNHRHSGIPLENRGCIAEYDAASEALTLWTSTQIPHLVRTGLADSLGMPEHQIRVIAPDVGGGFGIKGHLFPEEIAVSLLARRTGRPVKWIEDRTEHLTASIHAREHHHTLQVAYSADGTVEALRARIYVDCGAYSVYPWTSTMDTGMALGILPGPYRIRHYECEAYSVATNKCPLGPYRGVSRPAACFSIERALDEVAHATGLDPLEVRRRNLVQPEDFPYESITGLIYDSGSYVESLDKILEDADYGGLRRMQEQARGEGRHIGIGFACYTEQTAHTTTEFAKRGVPIIFGYDAATVRMDPSGKVAVHLSTHSHGQGHETTMAQIVADRLGLPLEDVRVAFGDTSSTPYGHGTFASRSAVLGGGACHRAGDEVRSRLVRFAAHHLEASEDDLVVAGGRISVAGSPNRGVDVAELARWAYHRPEKLPPGMEPVLEAVATYDADPGTGTFANAAHLVVVDVDIETGSMKLLEYHVVEDCGRDDQPTDRRRAGPRGRGAGDRRRAARGDGLRRARASSRAARSWTTCCPARPTYRRSASPISRRRRRSRSRGSRAWARAARSRPARRWPRRWPTPLRPIGHVFVNELPLTPPRVRRFVEEARA